MDVLKIIQMLKACLLVWHNGIVLMKMNLIFRLKYGDILVKSGRANLRRYQYTVLSI